VGCLERFVEKLNKVPDTVLIKAEEATSLRKRRDILIQAGIEEAKDVDGAYLVSAIEKVYETREI